MLQPESSKPLQMPSVAARLIGEEKSRNTFFMATHLKVVSLY